MEDDQKKWKTTSTNIFFDPTRMMTSKINGRQPQTQKKMKTTSKKNQKMEAISKKINLIGCDTIVN